MFGIKFTKSSPTTYVIQYSKGLVKREGAGLSFFYYAPTSVLVMVPLSSADVPFVFNEVSEDYQSVTLQGQLTYRVRDPKRLASLFDFSIAPSGASQWVDNLEKLKERLIHATQVRVAGMIQKQKLNQSLVSSDMIVSEVLTGLKESESVTMLGVEILGLSILAIKPTPEMSKAMEAEAREQLMRRADEALYARRNAAVEQERTIKENELKTEIAVEEKRRQIREAKMAADIAVEQKRAALIEQKVENDRKEADTKAYALEAMLKPMRQTDWRVLMAANGTSQDPKGNIALAFLELAQNAEKIEHLSITPELLTSLFQSKSEK